MEHKDIILNRSAYQYIPSTKETIKIEEEQPFTFSAIYQYPRTFEPVKDKVIFTNVHYVGTYGITLNRVYVLERLKFSGGDKPHVQFGIINDYGEKKFYHKAAFSLFNDDF